MLANEKCTEECKSYLLVAWKTSLALRVKKQQHTRRSELDFDLITLTDYYCRRRCTKTTTKPPLGDTLFLFSISKQQIRQNTHKRRRVTTKDSSIEKAYKA